MLKKIDRINGVFVALDEMGRRVFIQESISFIFQVAVDGNRVTYKPLDYRCTDVLEEIENYLVGSKLTDMNVIETIVVRYGWMDSRLNKLSFRNLTTVMEEIRAGEADKPTKRKLTAICKQLSLSMKRVSK